VLSEAVAGQPEREGMPRIEPAGILISSGSDRVMASPLRLTSLGAGVLRTPGLQLKISQHQRLPATSGPPPDRKM
jgi:hypothetical protein